MVVAESARRVLRVQTAPAEPRQMDADYRRPPPRASGPTEWLDGEGFATPWDTTSPPLSPKSVLLSSHRDPASGNMHLSLRPLTGQRPFTATSTASSDRPVTAATAPSGTACGPPCLFFPRRNLTQMGAMGGRTRAIAAGRGPGCTIHDGAHVAAAGLAALQRCRARFFCHGADVRVGFCRNTRRFARRVAPHAPGRMAPASACQDRHGAGARAARGAGAVER